MIPSWGVSAIRETGWRVAPVFCPSIDRHTYMVRGSLLQWRYVRVHSERHTLQATISTALDVGFRCESLPRCNEHVSKLNVNEAACISDSLFLSFHILSFDLRVIVCVAQTTVPSSP